MAGAASVLEALQRWSQRIGPYLLIELLLPGGTLLALSLFLYRHYPKSVPPPVRPTNSTSKFANPDACRKERANASFWAQAPRNVRPVWMTVRLRILANHPQDVPAGRA
jgi:hypothetical protein